MQINIKHAVANCEVIINLCYLTLDAVLHFAGAFCRANVGFGSDSVLKCFD